MNHLLKQKDKILSNVEGKTALVCRYGAIGDLIMITPVLKELKKQGYYVVMNMQTPSNVVLTSNPYIDAKIVQKPDEIDRKELDEYWDKLSEGFDKFINLSGSIEGELLKSENTAEYYWSKEKRHEECNKNYIDHTMELAGFHIKGAKTEMHFSKTEHKWARQFMRKYQDKYVILWSLSGSSFHKVYPYTEYVATTFLDQHPDAVIITVGDVACKILEWEHPRTKSMSDEIKLRKALLLTQYVDLVVGTETGLMNAAACYNTPKIIMLSHSTEENLTKYWNNVDAIAPSVSCYPCHQLHYTNKSCKQNTATNSPICMTMIRPEQVLLRIEDVYNKKRRKIA